MSENERNLTPAERIILNKLNTKALLIIEAEETLKEAKMPIDTNILHELSEEDLIGLIKTWNVKTQDILKKKHMKK